MAEELKKVYELLGDVFKAENIMNEACGVQLCYKYTTEAFPGSGTPVQNLLFSEDADKAYDSLKELRKIYFDKNDHFGLSTTRKGPDQTAKGPDQTTGLKAQIAKLSGEKRKAEMKVFDLKADLKQAQETYEGLVSRVEDIIGAGNNMADELQHLRKKHKELEESVFENFRKERGLD